MLYFCTYLNGEGKNESQSFNAKSNDEALLIAASHPNLLEGCKIGIVLEDRNISIEEYIEQEEGRCNSGMILTAVANLSTKKMIYINKIYHPKKEEENV